MNECAKYDTLSSRKGRQCNIATRKTQMSVAAIDAAAIFSVLPHKSCERALHNRVVSIVCSTNNTAMPTVKWWAYCISIRVIIFKVFGYFMHSEIQNKIWSAVRVIARSDTSGISLKQRNTAFGVLWQQIEQ